MDLLVNHRSEQKEYEIKSNNGRSEIHLGCIPSTGASWFIQSIDGLEIGTFAYVDKEEDEMDEGHLLIGAEHVQNLIVFGKGTIHLSYKRPWNNTEFNHAVITVV